MERLSMPLLVLNGAPTGVFPEKNPKIIVPPIAEKSGVVGPEPGRAKGPNVLVKLEAVNSRWLNVVQLDWFKLSIGLM
jgi:hypothetical protein